MKKCVYIYLILIFFIGKSFGYNEKDLAKLKAGNTNLQSSNLQDAKIKKISIKNVKFNNAYLENTLFDGVNFKNCSFKNANLINTVFIRCGGLSKQNQKTIRKHGGYIADYSVILESDIHYPKRKGKVNKYKKIIEIGKNKKNKVIGIIIAGDMVDSGTKSLWDKFMKSYYKPIKNGVPNANMYMCLGNHDRWGGREKWYASGSYALNRIKKMGGGSFFYEKLLNKKTNNINSKTHIVSLGECPAFNDYESAKWFANFKFKSPSIMFFHYTPIDMVAWWTTNKEALTNEDREKKEKNQKKKYGTKHKQSSEETKEFYNIIKKRTDNIMIIHVGHDHTDTFYKDWHGIPLVCTGGNKVFALAHLDRHENKCIAIEAIGRKKDSKARKIYFPTRESITGRISSLSHRYLGRNATKKEVNSYLKIWFKNVMQHGWKISKIKQAILRKARAMQPKLIIQWFEKYHNRKPTQKESDFILNYWSDLGEREGVQKYIQKKIVDASKKGLKSAQEGKKRDLLERTIILAYKDFSPKPTEEEINYVIKYLKKKWPKLGLYQKKDRLMRVGGEFHVVKWFKKYHNRRATTDEFYVLSRLNWWTPLKGQTISWVENKIKTIKDREGQKMYRRIEKIKNWAFRQKVYPTQSELCRYLDMWNEATNGENVKEKIKKLKK